MSILYNNLPTSHLLGAMSLHFWCFYAFDDGCSWKEKTGFCPLMQILPVLSFDQFETMAESIFRTDAGKSSLVALPLLFNLFIFEGCQSLTVLLLLFIQTEMFALCFNEQIWHFYSINYWWHSIRHCTSLCFSPLSGVFLPLQCM